MSAVVDFWREVLSRRERLYSVCGINTSYLPATNFHTIPKRTTPPYIPACTSESTQTERCGSCLIAQRWARRAVRLYPSLSPMNWTPIGSERKSSRRLVTADTATRIQMDRTRSGPSTTQCTKQEQRRDSC